jgi:Holliday junction resolvasome RuvABC DNA-binding subunit
MPTNPWEPRAGHIPGLRLPLNTWAALRAEGIMTIKQLRAMVDQIHRLPGIGSKSAQLIRDELARVASEEKPPGKR